MAEKEIQVAMSNRKLVQTFKPRRLYKLTKDYDHEAYPLKYHAKSGEILIFAYKAAGGYAQFFKAIPDEKGINQPIMMKATEALRLLEELDQGDRP